MRTRTESAITSGGSAMCASSNRIIRAGNFATVCARYSKKFIPPCAEPRNPEAPSTREIPITKLQVPERCTTAIEYWSLELLWGFGALVLFAFVLARHHAVF